MAVRPIRLYGDPVLRETASPVTEITPEIRALAQDMIDTMIHASGLGLAAPQVGELQRMFVLNTSSMEPECLVEATGSLSENGNYPMVLINPKIIRQEGEQTGEEGCLSFPELYDKVTRPEQVRVAARDMEGREVELEGRGILARALAHETDHLDGILFIDRMSRFRLRFLQGRLRRMKKSAEDEIKGE